ncbi:Os05g0295000 [Oryza sativa Japonica Group]|uniref:Os05g0295000 protein n=1 Tax=Oryza sativa subsp. japonica TaxID=39947 RepID=A0A0P0WK80_ORYSJ|nr:Os05g0295000 [Oryza sativa Japonica Group]
MKWNSISKRRMGMGMTVVWTTWKMGRKMGMKKRETIRDMNSDMILDGQDGGSKENGDKMTEQEARVEEEEEELKKMADQIIDVVVEDMLGEIYDRVAREGEE